MPAVARGAVRLDATRVNAARKRLGLTRERLADLGEGDISESTIQRAERGQSISLAKARVLATLLSVDLADLIPSDDAPRVTERSRDVPRSRLMLAERDAELSVLEEAWQRACRGEPRLVLVEGPAGIGKSALLRSFFDGLDAGEPVLFGRGAAVAASRMRYRPVVEALSGHSRWLAEPLEPVHRERLAAFVHGPVAGESDATGDTQRLRLFEAVAEAMIHGCERRPLVLCIEDLHWLDVPSLELLEYVVGRAMAPAPGSLRRLLVVATLRPAAPEPTDAPGDEEGDDDLRSSRAQATVARLRRESGGQTLRLGTLSESGTFELLAMAGIRHAPVSLVSTVHRFSGGNPLFVLEVARSLLAQARQSGTPLASLVEDEAALALPTDLEQAVASRAARLDGESRDVVSWGAFLGDPFDLQTLATVCDRSIDALAELLDPCVEGALVEELDPGVYSFVHPMVRQALYRAPLPARRQRMHAEIARRLAGDTAGAVDARAVRHWVGAGILAPPEALPLLCAAADESRSACDWLEAARYCRAALRILAQTGQGDDAAEAALHQQAGYAFNRAFCAAQASVHYRRALSLFEALDERVGVARVLHEVVRADDTLTASGADRNDVERLEACVADLGDAEPRLRAEMLDTLATYYVGAGMPELGRERSLHAVALAEELEDAELRADLSSALAWSLLERLQVREALAEWELGLRLSRQVGNVQHEARQLQRLPIPLYSLGRLDDVDDLLGAIRTVSERAQNLGEPTYALAAVASSRLLRADFEQADALADEAIDRARRSGYALAVPLAFLVRACSLTHRGQFDAARGVLAELADPERNGGHPGDLTGYAARFLALVDAHAGTLDTASLSFPRPAPGGEYPIELMPRLCLRAQLAAMAERPELIAGLYDALELAAQRGVELCLGWPLSVQRMLGLCAALMQRPEEARAHLERAVVVTERLGAPLELAQALLDLAELYVAKGGEGAGEARAPLARARQLAERHGLSQVRHRARTLTA